QLRDEVTSAITYPVILVCAMGGSVIFLLVYVLPRFSVMFSEMGRALPLQARALLALSAALRGYWWAGMGAIVLGGAGLRYAVQMIAVGEDTGKLDEMLIRIAEHFDREVRLRINQFTRLLEPVLILVMGLGVGFIVVSMLSAIFSVNDLPM